MVLPLREPIAITKQALSVDQLSNGRFLLGVSTGDRPSEYPAFGIDSEKRAKLFRDAYSLIKAVADESFPVHQARHFGSLDGSLDLIPRLCFLAADGRSRSLWQDISWLAENMDGWHQINLEYPSKVIELWRSAYGSDTFKPYGYGAFFELDNDPNAPVN